MSPPLPRRHSIDVEYEPGSTAGCSTVFPLSPLPSSSSLHRLTTELGRRSLVGRCSHTCRRGSSHSRHEEEQKSTISSCSLWFSPRRFLCLLCCSSIGSFLISQVPCAGIGVYVRSLGLAWVHRLQSEFLKDEEEKKKLRRFTEKTAERRGERKAFVLCASVLKVSLFPP